MALALTSPGLCCFVNLQLMLQLHCRPRAAFFSSSNQASFVGACLCNGHQPPANFVGVLGGPARACCALDTLGFSSACSADHLSQEGLSPAGPGAVPPSPAVGTAAAGCVIGHCIGAACCPRDCAYRGDTIYW